MRCCPCEGELDLSSLRGREFHPICAVEGPGCPPAAWRRDCLIGGPLKAEKSYCVLTWRRQRRQNQLDKVKTREKKEHKQKIKKPFKFKMLLLWMKEEHYLSLLALSWDVSSGQALPSILFLASAYSASRWARDLTCGVGLFWLKGDPSEPLLAGRFKMRICGGGAAGRDSSWITMADFSRVGE